MRAHVVLLQEEMAVKPVFRVGGVAGPESLFPKHTMEESVLRAQVVLALLPEETAIKPQEHTPFASRIRVAVKGWQSPKSATPVIVDPD